MTGPVSAYSPNSGTVLISQPISFQNAPKSTDVNYNLGQIAIVESANASYILTSKVTTNGIVSAIWTSLSGSTGIEVINGDVGSVSGNTITLTGGSSGAVFTGSGTTMTESFEFLALPVTDNAGRGSISIGSEIAFHEFDSATSYSNVYVGPNSGNFTNTALNQTAVGANSLALTISSHDSVALGFNSLKSLNTGGGITALGCETAQNLSSGLSVTCVGDQSLINATSNTQYTTLLGASTGTSYTGGENSNILLGAQVTGTAGETNTLRIGAGTGSGNGQLNRAFISGISGIGVSNQQLVTINTVTDQLGSGGSLDGGVFTPSVAGANTTGTATYGTRSGMFVQIGNFVLIQIFIVWTASTGLGQLLITGLPKMVGSTAPTTIPAPFNGFAAGANQLVFITPLLSTTSCSVAKIDQTTSSILPVNIAASGNISFQGTYSIT